MIAAGGFSRVLTAGEFGAEKDTLVKAWWEAARIRALEGTREHLAWTAKDLRPDDLLFIGTAGSSKRQRVEELLRTGATAVIHLSQISRLPEAIDWCRKYPNVRDLTGGSGKHRDRFVSRLEVLYGGDADLYPQIAAFDKLRGNGPFGIFPSTPFAGGIGGPFLRAVGAVFRAPLYEIHDPGPRHAEGTVWQNVVADIVKSDIVILNTRETPDGRMNPNVWSEFGFTKGWNKGRKNTRKRLIFFRHCGDKATHLPSDVHGIVYAEYEDDIDLASQLFFGQPERLRYCHPGSTP